MAKKVKLPSSPPAVYDTLFPRFAKLTKDVVMKETWENPNTPLSVRDRLLISMALLSVARPERLRSMIRYALANGVSKDEIHEVFLHVGFYGGWPSAVTAYEIAKQAYDAQAAALKPAKRGKGKK